jgi:hypothetical protein
MGIPAAKVEATWRNNVSDVALFFAHYHPGHFMIYNISERSYDYSKFQHRVCDQSLVDELLSLSGWLADDAIHRLCVWAFLITILHLYQYCVHWFGKWMTF